MRTKKKKRRRRKKRSRLTSNESLMDEEYTKSALGIQ
jgi:hypothetical protein